MPVRVGLNGAGRIGRALIRHLAAREDVELLAANDLLPAPVLARLLARDSVYGRAPFPVRVNPGGLSAGRLEIRLTSAGNPAEIPWAEAGVEIVFEATGRMLRHAQAAAHLRGSVERVIVTAAAPEADLTLLAGINDRDFDPARHRILSAGSCTAQCLGPLIAVLLPTFGIRTASMTTVHPYTTHQPLLDGGAGTGGADTRRSRAAGLSMIPTTTTAISAIERVFPALAGRIAGLAVRVPTPAVSLLELVVHTDRPVSEAALRQAFLDAEAGRLAGLLGTSSDEPVSVDLLGDDRAAIVDLPLTSAIGDRMARVVAWYDNEWAYAGRLVATALALASRAAHPAPAARQGAPSGKSGS